jgi:hypothetical protein
VGLERSPLSLVSAIEELRERKSNGSGLEIREYGLTDPLRLSLAPIFPQTLALISRTDGGHLIGIVRTRTHATEFVFFCLYFNIYLLGQEMRKLMFLKRTITRILLF